MYGPKQRYVDPFEKAQIPKWYQCSHTHVSGRRCKRMVGTQKTACVPCRAIEADYCQECIQMLAAFGLR